MLNVTYYKKAIKYKRKYLKGKDNQYSGKPTLEYKQYISTKANQTAGDCHPFGVAGCFGKKPHIENGKSCACNSSCESGYCKDNMIKIGTKCGTCMEENDISGWCVIS